MVTEIKFLQIPEQEPGFAQLLRVDRRSLEHPRALPPMNPPTRLDSA